MLGEIKVSERRINCACACHHVVDHSRHQTYVFFNTVTTNSVASNFKISYGFCAAFRSWKIRFQDKHSKAPRLTLLKDPLSRNIFSLHSAIHRIEHWGEDAWKIMRFQDICSLFPSPHPKQKRRTAHAGTVTLQLLKDSEAFKTRWIVTNYLSCHYKVELIALNPQQTFKICAFEI